MRRLLVSSVLQHAYYPGSRLNPEVDAIIGLSIQDAHWKYGWPTLANIFHTVACRIQEINHTRQIHEQLRLPARSTVYRRVKAASHPMR